MEGFEVFSNEFELCLFIPGVFSEYLIFGEMTADRSRLEACRTGGRPEISLIYNRIVLSALFIWKEARTEMMNRGRSNDELTFIYNVRFVLITWMSRFDKSQASPRVRRTCGL